MSLADGDMNGAPALAALFALLAVGSGAISGVADLLASPAALLALVVLIGATYGE
ncbi:MAG: hypothetical protein ABH863_03065 [Candidatus Micrarchaeota archaeon]